MFVAVLLSLVPFLRLLEDYPSASSSESPPCVREPRETRCNSISEEGTMKRVIARLALALL